MIRTVRLRVTRDTTKPQMLRKVLFDTGGNHLNSHQKRESVLFYIFSSYYLCRLRYSAVYVESWDEQYAAIVVKEWAATTWHMKFFHDM